MKSWQSMYNLMDWYDHLERLAAIEAKKKYFCVLRFEARNKKTLIERWLSKCRQHRLSQLSSLALQTLARFIAEKGS